TLAKVGTLLAVIALGLVFGGGAARAANLARPAFATDLGARGTAMQLGAAMVGALFSADAWANVTFAAGEVRDGRRTVPRALVLAGARVGWAMARDGRFLGAAARLNARHVPGPALWIQGAWASVLALSGRYGDLLDYVIVAELLFYLLTVGGLLVLARRRGERPRGAGYPWLQVAYLVLVAALVVDLLVTKPAYTWGSVA